jgi:hypothetical protein
MTGPDTEGYRDAMRHSRQCMSGQHPECGHVAQVGVDFREAGRVTVIPCICSCHSTCLLTGRGPMVSRAIWVGLCTCAGEDPAEARIAEVERRWRNGPAAS